MSKKIVASDIDLLGNKIYSAKLGSDLAGNTFRFIGGIATQDTRNSELLPRAGLDTQILGFFSPASQVGSTVGTDTNNAWNSGIYVKGWDSTYAAWELIGPGGSSVLDSDSLYWREGTEKVWQSTRKIYDSKNLNKNTVLDIVGTLDIAHGGTGATTVDGARKNLTQVDANKITEDTQSVWKEHGNISTSYFFINSSTTHIDTPKNYFMILNLTNGNQELSQIGFSQPSGQMFRRGANSTGWNGKSDLSGKDAWKQIYDEETLTKTVITNLLGSDTYLSIHGGTLTGSGNCILSINTNNTSNENYAYFKINNVSKASVGYLGGIAFVANEPSGYARIGVTDTGVPQYWPTNNNTNAKTLYHEGNLTKDVVTNILGSTTYAPYNSAGYLPLSGGSLSGNLLPKTTEKINLGSSTYKWNTAYIKDIAASSIYPSGGGLNVVVSSGNIIFTQGRTISADDSAIKFSFGLGNGAIVPSVTNDTNLGSFTKVWKNGYFTWLYTNTLGSLDNHLNIYTGSGSIVLGDIGDTYITGSDTNQIIFDTYGDPLTALVPGECSSVDLGTDTKRWNNIYSVCLYTDGIYPIEGMSNGMIIHIGDGKVCLDRDDDLWICGYRDSITLGSAEQHSPLSCLLPYKTDTTDLGSSANKWRDLYLSGDAHVGDNLYVDGNVDIRGLIELHGGIDFSNAIVTGLDTGSEWYNIRAKKIVFSQGQEFNNLDDLFVAIDNYNSKLLDRTKYRFVFLRWINRKQELNDGSGFYEKCNTWRSPFFTQRVQDAFADGTLETTAKTTTFPNSQMQYGDCWWRVVGAETRFFYESGHDYSDFLNLDYKYRTKSARYVFKKTQNAKMKFGCALYKHTGKGTQYGWERVSNIAVVELYCPAIGVGTLGQGRTMKIGPIINIKQE